MTQLGGVVNTINSATDLKKTHSDIALSDTVVVEGTSSTQHSTQKKTTRKSELCLLRHKGNCVGDEIGRKKSARGVADTKLGQETIRRAQPQKYTRAILSVWKHY